MFISAAASRNSTQYAARKYFCDVTASAPKKGPASTRMNETRISRVASASACGVGTTADVAA